MTIKTIITKIQNTQGNNAKMEVVADSANDNALLKKVLYFTYTPRLSYFIKLGKKDIEYIMHDDEVIEYDIEESYTNLLIMLNTLSKGLNRGKEARTKVLDFIANIKDKTDREIMINIVNRDLKINLGTKLINKALKEELIEEYPYQRCSLIDKSNWNKLPWEEGVFVQLKADGMFVNASVDSDSREWQFQSRQGSLFPQGIFEKLESDLDYIWECLSQDKNMLDYVISGELLIYDIANDKVLERKVGNGMLNSIMQDGNLEDGLSVIFEVWDIYLKDYKKDKTTYRERYELLNESINKCEDFVENVMMIETYIVSNPKDALQITNRFIANGYEGSIVKCPNAPFKNGTSKDFIKFKIDLDVELVITSWNEGKGKYENSLGSLICESFCGKVLVNVSGFTDKQRKEFFDNIDHYIGKIITVRSNGLIENATSEVKSMYLPRFIEVRGDKSEADSYEKILEQFESLFKGD